MSPNQDTYADVTGRILSALERGTVPWRKPWRAGMPENLSGRPYRGVNVLLLQLASMTAGWTDNRFGTFRAVKNAGGNVRKGEHGTRVILWKPVRRAGVDENGEQLENAYMLLRSYTVFNADQCDGLPARETGEPFEPFERAEEIIAGMPAAPAIQESALNAASYSPAEDIVRLPARDSFDTPAGFYATAFHELTHAAGAENRAGGLDTSGGFGTDPYAREELIAEIGASMLAGVSGIDETGKTIENAAAYLEHWRAQLSRDPKLIVKAAAAAQRRADFICGVTFEDKPAGDATPAGEQLAGVA